MVKKNKHYNQFRQRNIKGRKARMNEKRKNQKSQKAWWSVTNSEKKKTMVHPANKKKLKKIIRLSEYSMRQSRTQRKLHRTLNNHTTIKTIPLGSEEIK
jgi:hypothetical protein